MVGWLPDYLWAPAGKTGYRLKEKAGCPQGSVATETSSFVCQVTTVGHILTIRYEPLVRPNNTAFFDIGYGPKVSLQYLLHAGLGQRHGVR